MNSLTTVAASALAVTLAVSVATVSASTAVTARQAIERAASDRLGEGVVRVDVGSLSTTVEPDPALVAVPDPAAYVGRSARFLLTVNGKRRGVAVAHVRVQARVAVMRRPVERQQRIERDDVAVVDNELADVRFARLPQLDEVIGARARRDLAPGMVVTSGLIVVPPAVQNGETVVVGVTIGRVHVTGEGMASGSGQVGDVVHVTQAGRRRRLKARVIEPGVVEVVQ